MLDGHAVPTQDFATNLIADAFPGVLVCSCPKGASSTDLNLVLWKRANMQAHRSVESRLYMTPLHDIKRRRIAVPTRWDDRSLTRVGLDAV